jgi:hypothetical protein
LTHAAAIRDHFGQTGMSERPKKSIGLAYLLWFVLGGLGAHRFYLNSPRMGIGLIVLFGGGAAIALYGLTLQDQGWLLSGLLCLGAWAVLLLVDAFRMPEMIEIASEEKDSERQSMAYRDIDMDPSPLAMQRRMGIQPRSDRPRGIPEGYEMPWRREAREKAEREQQAGLAEDAADWRDDKTDREP